MSRDVLSLQNEIVSAYAAQLRLRPGPGKAEQLARGRPVNPETYEAYLGGMYWFNKATPEGAKQGLASLTEAVDGDRGNATAYAGLARGYMTIAHGPDPPPNALSIRHMDETLVEHKRAQVSTPPAAAHCLAWGCVSATWPFR